MPVRVKNVLATTALGCCLAFTVLAAAAGAARRSCPSVTVAGPNPRVTLISYQIRPRNIGCVEARRTVRLYLEKQVTNRSCAERSLHSVSGACMVRGFECGAVVDRLPTPQLCSAGERSVAFLEVERVRG
jgi:hypothetical protein